MAEFTFICAFCNRRIRGDEGYRGMQIKCPGCGNEIDIPIDIPTGRGTEFPKTALDLHNESQTPIGVESNPSSTASKRSNPWAAIGVIVLFAILLWKNWDEVGRFLSSAKTQIGASLPSRTISGTWRTTEGNEHLQTDGKLSFHSDGTVIKDTTFYNLNGTYTISGDTITITWTGGKDFASLIKDDNRSEQYRRQGNDLIDLTWNNHLWYKTE